MKKSLVIMAMLSLTSGIFAQNVDDALRYSQIFYGGTARFMSMGGAFTALGGDISTLSQNPAGIGVFRASEFTITPQLFQINTKANFYGLTKDSRYNFNLNQIGIVSNIVSNESGLISFNIGYSFNKTNNLNSSVNIHGTNTNSSMADFWALDVNSRNNGNGVLYKDLLGNNGPYETYVIDTITGYGGRQFETVFSHYGDYPSQYGQNVRRLITNDGYTAENALSFGGNYNNKIYFGLTLGINKIRYTGHFEHLESVDKSYPGTFEDFTYTDHFENTGTGYSLKLGTIIRPVESVRIGLSFHSPTWYRINEYFTQNYSSNFTGFSTATFSTTPMRYKYALSTPFRALAGVAVQIKKIGLISADYEFVDYSTAKFSEAGDNYDYSDKNHELKNSLRAAHNFRVGGELRLSQLYLRTGYGYYGKAFATGEDNENMDYSSVSFGIGFREQKVSLDLGYTNFMNNQKYVLYPLPENGSFHPAIANLNTTRNMFTLTLGYKFGY
jgi:hypothetical protein